MMIENTIETTVEFGEKASFSFSDEFFCSTSISLEEISLSNNTSYCSDTYITIDYSDKKKMDIYRKINRMLGV